MAKITEKKVKEPVREVNENGIDEVKEVKKEEKKLSAKEEALKDVRRLITFKQGAWLGETLNYDEVEGILNKYL